MPQFTVNTQRFDPYMNFNFRVKWDSRYVAGISKVSLLKRTTEVVKHREGGDPSSSRKSPAEPNTTQLHSSEVLHTTPSLKSGQTNAGISAPGWDRKFR